MEYTKGECGCKVSISGTIFYCPLHKSAPDLYEALKAVASCDIDKYFLSPLKQQIKQALAKAGGGS